MESSSTHFEVLGLGLEAYKSSKIALSSAKDSTTFRIINLLENARNLAENLRRHFFIDRLKTNFDDLFFVWRTLASVSLVLGLEYSCPWPWLWIGFVSLASSLAFSIPLLVTMTLPEERQNQVYY